MTRAADRAVARLTRPAEMVAIVPHLCGFVPTESVVLVSLRGPRNRVGLTARCDLAAWGVVDALDEELASRMRADGAREVLCVIYTEAPGDRPYDDLVEAIGAALADVGIPVQDALLVRAGRWWSYRCDSDTCCPAEGRPVTEEPSPAVGLIAATNAFDGRVVRSSRDDVAAMLAPPIMLAAVEARQWLTAQLASAAAEVAEHGQAAAMRTAVATWRAALERAKDPRAALTTESAAALAVGLQHLPVRDEVMTWALADAGSLLALLLDVARRTVAPYDVPVCTLLAVTSWLRGDGALANVALDRALAGDPGYSLALLAREGLDGQVPPKALRRWLAEARAVQPDLG